MDGRATSAPVGKQRDIVRERMVAERGFTNHLSGMYSDKFFHPRMQTDGGRYITIGDPYKEVSHDIPARWKKKQMQAPMYPQNSGGGYFGLMGKAFDYMPDRYVEQLPYGKREPYDQRKLGFGTHDASKRDEFTQRIRTEQYRDLLKREKRLMDKHGGHIDARIKAAHKKLAEQAKLDEEERKKANLDAPKHLYDIGRSRETKFDPKQSRDRFYNARKARVGEMRRGGWRSASQEIGVGAWAQARTEHFGRSHATRSFYSNSHLEVQDI